MKEHKYSNEEYTQYSASYIGYGDGKVYVEYNGRIEAFDETTLEPVWISEELSHEETNSETGKTIYYEKITSLEKVRLIDLSEEDKKAEYTLEISTSSWFTTGIFTID